MSEFFFVHYLCISRHFAVSFFSNTHITHHVYVFHRYSGCIYVFILRLFIVYAVRVEWSRNEWRATKIKINSSRNSRCNVHVRAREARRPNLGDESSNIHPISQTKCYKLITLTSIFSDIGFHINGLFKGKIIFFEKTHTVFFISTLWFFRYLNSSGNGTNDVFFCNRYWEIISKLLRNIVVRNFLFAGKRGGYLQFCFYEISYCNYRVMQWDLVMVQVHGQD